jgi:hypothetical protein
MSLASQSSINSDRNETQLSAIRDKNSKSQDSSIVFGYRAGLKANQFIVKYTTIICCCWNGVSEYHQNYRQPFDSSSVTFKEWHYIFSVAAT